MRALTLWRPWPAAIFALPEGRRKPVENRGWAPPAHVVGTRIAIHAGKRFDDDALDDLLEMLEINELPGFDHEGVIGTVLLRGYVRSDGAGQLQGHSGSLTREEAQAAVGSYYFSGPIGWVLREPLRLPKPVPCRGKQGLWTLDADTEARVRAQMPAGHQ